MFVRTILSRWSIAYEPSMVAWHDNRPTDEDLRRQIWGWGVGLSSYVTKLLTSSTSRADVWRRIPAGIRHARTLNRRDRSGAPARRRDRDPADRVDVRTHRLRP